MFVRLRLGVAVVAVGVAVAAAGCGSSSSTTAAGSSTSSSNGASSATSAGVARAEAAVREFQKVPSPDIHVPVTKPIPKNKLIVTTSNGLPDGLVSVKAFDQAASLLGWKTKNVGWTEATLSSVNGIMQGIAASSPRPDMVVSEADSATHVWPIGLHALNSAHIPVVISGTSDPVGNGIVASPLTGADYGKTSGVAMADWIAADSRGHGNVAIFNLPFLPSVAGVYAAIEQTLKRNCPQCEVATQEFSPSQLTSGQENQVITTYLLAHPSVKYVLNIYAGASPGIGAALQAHGLNTKVKFIGSTPTVDELASLKSGQIQGALNCSNTSYIGWYAADAAVRYFTNMSQTPNETAGEPIQLLDSSNKQDIPTGECTVPNNSSQAAYFSKLWHLGG